MKWVYTVGRGTERNPYRTLTVEADSSVEAIDLIKRRHGARVNIEEILPESESYGKFANKRMN